MGVVYGRRTNTNGLILHLDADNPKSYPIEPTVNVVTNTDLNTGWSTWYCTGILWNDCEPPAGIDSPVVSFYDADTSKSGYWYCYGDYAPQDPGTVYTVSIYVKTNDSNFKIRYYTADNAEVGRVSGQMLAVPNDGEWHRVVWPSFTNSISSTSDSLSFYFEFGNDQGESQRTWLCAPQMEAKDHATPFVVGTRSAVGAWKDLSGNGIHMDLTNMSFDSNAKMVFNGTTDKIITNWPAKFSPISNDMPRTWEAWFKPANVSNNQIIFGHKSGSGCSWLCDGGLLIYNGKIAFDWFDNTAYQFLGSTVPVINNWYHAVGVFDTSMIPKLYINGNLVDVYGSTTNLNYSNNQNDFLIGYNDKDAGGNWFNGQIPIVKYYYGKALTPVEVQQSFNIMRGRFGL